MFKELKAIIFDLDDTLFLERDFVKSGFRAVANYCHQQFNLPVLQSFDLLWTKFQNGARGNLFDMLIEVNPGYSTSVDELVRVYRNHKPDIQLVDGVENLIRSLKEDKRTGLISDGYLETQQKKIEALNISHLFDTILLTDSLGKNNWKPSPVPFMQVLNDLGVSPENSVYIADNPQKDFIFPNESGMKSIRIKYENGEYNDKDPVTEKHSPMITVDNVSELHKILINE